MIKGNPQLKDGYIRIANEVIESLVYARLNGTEMAIVLHVIRKTWGFKKKEDKISLSQFVKATGKSRRMVCTALASLVNKSVLVNKTTLPIGVYSFNKRYNEWVVNKPALVNKSPTTSEQSCQQLVNNCSHTKETLTKETIQKKRVAFATLDDIKIAKELATNLINTNIAFKQKFPIDSQLLKTKVERWAEDIEKMRRIDNVPAGQISMMIEWLFISKHKDALFWRGNVQSGAKLREQYTKLVSAMEREYKQNESKKAVVFNSLPE